jgi:hypothetical protein
MISIFSRARTVVELVVDVSVTIIAMITKILFEEMRLESTGRVQRLCPEI